jgi:hypothetical protein
MVDYPENDFTRMIEMTKLENRSGVRRNVGVASATPMPTVQSAAVGRPVEDEVPLTVEERAELDKKAIEAGVRDPRLGNQNPDGTFVDEPPPAYASLEEAIAAGAPVERPVPEADPIMHPRDDRMTAREFIARKENAAGRKALGVPSFAPRIPDFTKIEGIDLVNDRVVVDGLDFPITVEQSNEFKEFVMGVVRDAILAKLEEAATSFAARLTKAEGTDGAAGTASEGTTVQPQ